MPKNQDIPYEQLRLQLDHYRTLLDESMDPTFSFYPDGTYRYVNKAFADAIGTTPEDIIGKKIWDIFAKEEADKRFVVVQRVFATGKPEEIEVRVPVPSGDLFFLTTAKPIISNRNNVETVICTSKNITKRKLAEIGLQKEHDMLLDALKEIETLSEFLPICASCKKVRDDEGYWEKIEAYLVKHSTVELTHSLCPTCIKDIYGEEEWFNKDTITRPKSAKKDGKNIKG